MIIAVVHNASHHADSVLRVAEELARTDASIGVVVLCEPAHQHRVAGVVHNWTTRVIMCGAPASTDHRRSVQPRAIGRRVREALAALLLRYVRVKKTFNTNRAARAAFRLIEYNTVACIIREKKVELHFRRLTRDVERVFDELSPGVLLSWGDRNIDFEAAVLMVARQRGIKVMLPYVTISTVGGLLWSRRLFAEPKRWTPFSLYRVWANVALSGMIRDGFFFQEPAVLFAVKRLGGLSENPWCIGRGLSDAVCVDSVMTADRYASEGVPRAKLHIVGTPDYDALYRGVMSRSALRQRLIAEYQLDPTKEILVVALPQFAEQGVLGWNDHWVEIRNLLGAATKTNLSVVVSLHPRADSALYSFLEKELGIRISREPLREILPVAGAFLAVNSSTVVWAVLCGIKAFLLDFYGLDSSEYAKFSSVRHLRHRDSLLDDLRTGLAESTDFTRDWELLSRNEVFDGKVMERYRNLLYRLALTVPVVDNLPRGGLLPCAGSSA